MLAIYFYICYYIISERKWGGKMKKYQVCFNDWDGNAIVVAEFEESYFADCFLGECEMMGEKGMYIKVVQK